MSNALLVALTVAAVAVLAGLVLAGLRGLAAWRAFRGFQRSVLAGMDETNRRLAVLQARADAIPQKAERLAAARAALEGSLAEARVISEAFSEATAAFRAARTLSAL